MINYGKKFEQKFKEDFLKIPNSSLDRLYDNVSNYLGINNICDFIGYIFPNIFYIECKSIKGTLFPLQNLTQYERLLPKVGIRGVRVGVVIWFYEQNRVLYVPISSITKMKEDGLKSINLKTIDKYNYIEIPSRLKKTYMDSDYTILINTIEGD